MPRRRVFIIGAVALVAIIALGAYVARGAIALQLMTAFIDRAVAASPIDSLPDGLHVAFCGAGSPLPDRDRAGPCTAIIAGKRLFVFDAGEGSAETLALMGLNPTRVERVFLTHLHSAHIDGLGVLALQRWAGGAAHTPLPVYGPEGTARVTAGFNETYAIDGGYRTAHHGPEVAPPDGFGLAAFPFVFLRREERLVVYENEGVTIVAFKVAHAPTNGVGYRIDYGGHTVVISGDTAKADSIVREAQGADLLVHEALSPRLVGIIEAAAARRGQTGVAKIMHDIPDYHTSPEDVAREAQTAGVPALAITHQIPPLRLRALEGPFLGKARSLYHGRLMVMHDGDLLSITAQGLSRRNLLN